RLFQFEEFMQRSAARPAAATARSVARLHLLARDRQQFFHLAADAMIGHFHILRIEIGANLAEHILIALLFHIGDHNFLGISLGVLAAQAKQLRSPQADQLVATRHDAELLLLLMGEFVFASLFTIVES